MKAITYQQYGSLDVLHLTDIDKPIPKDNEVLVRVHAAGLHVGDVFTVKGSPLPVRMDTGLFKPKYGVPGYDVAGVVEAVGAGVTGIEVGDEVFGAGHGTCAEYTISTAQKLAPKPANLPLEQAAVLCTSGLAALHGLRDAGKLQAGDNVLINGASGGVGTYAVQIAKALGATVTGVCGRSSVDLVASLGADEVIDYTQQDFTQSGARFDLILDNVENRDLSEVRRALKPAGRLVLNSGTSASGLKFLVILIKPLLLSPFSKQSLKRFLSIPKRDDLDLLGQLVEGSKLRPVIDRTYPLEQTADALRYIESGHAHGKVAVTMPSV